MTEGYAKIREKIVSRLPKRNAEGGVPNGGNCSVPAAHPIVPHRIRPVHTYIHLILMCIHTLTTKIHEYKNCTYILTYIHTYIHT